MKHLWLYKLIRGYWAPLLLVSLLLILPINTVRATEQVYLDSIYIVDSAEDETRNDPYFSFNFTVPETCQNAYLLVANTGWGSDKTTAITYADVAMTSLYYDDYSASNIGVSLWGLIAPSNGTNLMYFTTNGISERPTLVSLYCNVDQSDPFGYDNFITTLSNNYSYVNSGTVPDFQTENSAFFAFITLAGNDDINATLPTGFELVGNTGNWNGGKIASIYDPSVSNPPAQFTVNLTGSGYGSSLIYNVFNYQAPASGGLTFTEIQYNPVSGNVFLAGTCTINGSGVYQMELDASTNFNSETFEWDSIDPTNQELVSCLEDGTFTALYRGSELTGTTTIILDDSFYGTSIITTEVIFYEPTGYIKFNWGDLVSVSTLKEGGTDVSLPFVYDVCSDPDYSTTSSYIFLGYDTVGANDELISILSSTSSPRVQIPTCSGTAHIDFTMPYNSNFEGEGYFVYADVYGTPTIFSSKFYIFIHPKALKDGSWVYFGDSSNESGCNPPSYDPGVICAGIPSTTLGDLQCSFKYGLVAGGQALFLPSCSSRKFITDQFYKFKDAFPFSAFFDLTDTIGTAITSAQNSTSTEEGIKIPFIRKTATSTEYFMMSLATSTSFVNLIGQDNYNTYLMTIGFVYWIIIAGVIFFIIWKV